MVPRHVSRLQLHPVPIADPLPRPCRGAGAGGAGGERRQLAVRAMPSPTYLACAPRRVSDGPAGVSGEIR